jgi:hypothetical protein
MTRKPLLLLAPVLASVSLLGGPAIASAKAAPAAAKIDTSYPFCVGGLPIVHSVCINV